MESRPRRGLRGRLAHGVGGVGTERYPRKVREELAHEVGAAMMPHEERLGVGVAVAIGVAALSVLEPAAIAVWVSVALIGLALVAMLHPALPFFHGQRVPGRLLLACVLLGAAIGYSDSSPLALAGLGALGTAVLVDAFLAASRETPPGLSSATSRPRS